MKGWAIKNKKTGKLLSYKGFVPTWPTKSDARDAVWTKEETVVKVEVTVKEMKK